ncbi:MAG: histidine kinase [Burkholderiales bacterium RIFCSPLOWO2_12_FULL_64_99]|jgi:diguanylate cyclase (GGDEF)-like protein|uniref:sensor domain-containing diguanylate cyclase n=1 Tax=Aquabacterium sp. TaxID=1872578 RepID=UPI0008D1AF32|nr:GGDEF domain-containing protein [Aquabacterium sp.]OGB05555.1 MAG: histidine kinase [Burkholderiales bacterium RIFCSPHIGHO2_12_FULL_63_20]OGB67493.1 MAG: histidine kinase [Burkholderiales bacterium RIFCSPLOWO2_12_FULL_64_99]
MPTDLYAEMFDLAPVSLWLEDFSAVKAQFDQWRQEGVTDLRHFLREQPARVANCSRLIQVLRVNQRTLSLFGARNQDELVAALDQVFRDDMFAQHIEELGQLWDGQLRFESDTVNYTLQGTRLDIALKATVLPGHEGSWARVLLALEDTTERRRAERALRQSERYAKGLFEHSPVSLWVEDFSGIQRLLAEVRTQGVEDFRTFLDVHPEFVVRCMQEIRVIDINQQTLDMFRAPDKDTLLSKLECVFRDDMRPHFAEQLLDLWHGRLFQQREVLNYDLHGDKVHVYLQLSVLPGHEAEWDQVLVSLTDISARKKAEAYLEYLGQHDALTGLRNRAFFSDELNRLERRGPWPISVIVIDVNNLKLTNDENGHAGGDAQLRRLGEVLRKAVERPATASRIGGDEFALLLPATDARGAEHLIDQLHELIAVNNQFHGGIPLSVSIGRATSQDGERLEQLVHRADQEMYNAKRRHYARQDRDRRQAD